MADHDVKRYKFDDWQLDPVERQLVRHGEPIPLTPKVFETLLVLVERAGRLVSKEDFMERVWPDAFVEDAVLTQNISQLRKVLGDPRAIETVSKKGYRFLKPVKAITDESVETQGKDFAPDEATSSRTTRRRLITTCLLLMAVLTIGIAYVRIHNTPASASHEIHSLAVLPLENLSGDPNQEYFSDGMTDELITDLAQIHSLRVISRTSVVQFKHSKKKLSEIAAELNVDAVVEGSVVRTGNDVRITAQLLDAREDRHLWAASYEREMGNVLRLQAQIARAIAEQVNANLTREEGTRLAARPSMSPESYDALLTGKYLFNRRNPADTEKAIVHLSRAVELDPQNAPAWATLAYCYTALGADLGASDPAKVLPLARSAIDKALQIDPNLAEAHLTLAWMKLWYDWDWSGSEAEFQRALQLNPNDSATHREYAHLLQVQKRFDEAIAENRRAIDLAPLDILASIHLAWSYVDANAGPKAVEQAKRVLEMDPNFTGAHLMIALGYEEQGEWSEAIAAYEKARKQYPADYLPGVAYAYAASGDTTRANAAFARLVEYSRKNYISPLSFAACYAARGDKDHAFEFLEKAYKQRATGMIGLSVNHQLESLRSDSRFKEMLRLMKLPD